MFVLSVFLVGQATGGVVALLPLVLILVIFYLLLILPAQRRQKKVADMQRSLKAGDKVITSGGIYGVIVGADGDTVHLRVADQVKVRVSRSAVSGLQPESKED
jgi:preprotein translocase subunit YajC